MALVSGEDWAKKLITGEDTENPYVAEYPVTKWDASPVETGCPTCDCTATVSSLTTAISNIQKYSEYQETVLQEIISQLRSRIAAEGGGEAKATRSSAVGGVATLYGEDRVISDFWAGLQQIDRMFMSRGPLQSDIAMLQAQLANIDRFASLYTLDSNKVVEWQKKLNGWITTAASNKGKGVYFAKNTSAFGSGV